VAQCYYMEPDPKRKAGRKGDGICDFMYHFPPSPRVKIRQVSHEWDGTELSSCSFVFDLVVLIS